MKSILSFFVLILLAQNVVFAGGSYEDNRKIIQSDANYRDLLHIYFKGTNTELTDEVIANYIKDFNESDYNYRQNEFEWSAILNRNRIELTSIINNANLSTVYTFQTGVSLGNYNFERGGFDVNINMEYLFLTKRGLSIGDGTTYPDVASKGILIFINDINNYNFFRMERNEANAFINSRTKNGNVDRNITLKVSFSISNFFPNTGIFLIAQTNNSVSARITKIDVYNDNTKIGELTSAIMETMYKRKSLNEQIGISDSTDVFYIYDFANVLNNETKKHITGKNESLNKEKDVHFIIETVTTTGDINMEDYSLQMWNIWIGDASNSNALLFIIRIMPTRWDWQLRWGNGSTIRNIGGENILNTIRRFDSGYFNNGRYEEGIISIHDAIFNMF
jgi:hypothetical protein